jgi:hypothetical protein
VQRKTNNRNRNIGCKKEAETKDTTRGSKRNKRKQEKGKLRERKKQGARGSKREFEEARESKRKRKGSKSKRK